MKSLLGVCQYMIEGWDRRGDVHYAEDYVGFVADAVECHGGDHDNLNSVSEEIY